MYVDEILYLSSFIILVKVLSVATTSSNMLISIITMSWLTLTAGTPSLMGSPQSTLARISGPSKGVKQVARTGGGLLVVAREEEDGRMKNISMEVWLEQNEDRKGHYAGIRR